MNANVRIGRIEKIKQRMAAGALACTLSIMMACSNQMNAWAVEAGTYLVTVSPSYSDPETGKIEDPGNNEAIGQGMCERMCNSTGLLEVDSSGNMYLTVRYYLSQFINNVSFDERSGGGYNVLSYEEMQTKEPVEGSADISEKYGYTDYRMKISSLSSVFRGKAYVEPMGRDVVFFLTAAGPVSGSGDFIVNNREDETAEAMEETETQKQDLSDRADKEEGNENETYETDSDVTAEQERSSLKRGTSDNRVDGSGNAYDPVTGIPEKSSLNKTAGKTAESSAETVSAEYHLETPYDLSRVSIKEARKLTDPMLEKAVGITGMTGDMEKAESSLGGGKTDENKTVMLVLLGLSAVLAAWFGLSALSRKRLRKQAEKSRGGEETENRQRWRDER